MNRVSQYLHIPQGYCERLGGLRWSSNGEAVEYAGNTFVLSPQIALFLEGFAAGHRLIHFGFILHLLHLLGLGTLAPPPEAGELARAFQDAARPLRNAGALCARLCRDVPPAPDPPEVEEVCRRLSSSPLMAELAVGWATSRREPAADRADPAAETVELILDSSAAEFNWITEMPPLDPEAFEAQVVRGLAAYSPAGLRHWFRCGRGPVSDAGGQVARETVAIKPRSLAGALAGVARRPRLAGAIPLVAHLVSALALPPRRLARPELPIGGYADVATRGHPEQVLPSQLALDDLEFLRRFAAHELLYFRREEPHVPVAEELVVLVDQGVRTWGDVRLVLGAAVLAFGRLAARRGMPIRIGATSSGGKLVDPLELDDQALGALLEASDLTTNPGAALARVLEGPAVAPRDLVVLSHPRSLAAPEVATAARRAGPGTRLFTVAVDERGSVQVCEMKHGTPVKLSQFQVDLARAADPPPSVRSEDPGLPTPWRDDVEPIGFPFRFGIGNRQDRRLFDFDQAGDWILAAGGNGILHAWRTDGTQAEVLPRGMLGGVVLTQVDAVLGMAGGFVVAGRILKGLVAAVYDFADRNCTVLPLGPAGDTPWKWFYFHGLHVLVARGREVTYGVDLSTHVCYRLPGSSPPAPPRVEQAVREAQDYLVPPPQLSVVLPEPGHPPLTGPSVYLDRSTGTITVRGLVPEWKPFTPLADGVPILNDCLLMKACGRGNTLAATFRSPSRGTTLRLFRGPAGIPLGEYPLTPGLGDFTLSGDGRRLARELEDCQLEVRDVSGAGGPGFVTPKGKSHRNLLIELGDRWMIIRVGRLAHLIRWDRDRLNLSFTRRNSSHDFKMGVTAMYGATPSFVRYDPNRFVLAAQADVIVVGDVFGEVAVFDRSGALVCMFFIFRGQVAAWMPDGTRLGPPWMTGGPATPGALERIGTALGAASERGKGVRP